MMQPGKLYFSRIDSEGNISLPQEVANQLDVKEGDSITFNMNPNKLELGMIVIKTPPEQQTAQ